MAENDKNNFGGIAAIITALAGLVGAVAVIYNNVNPDSSTPETTQSKTISVQAYDESDLCACLNECIKNIPNHFDSIKSDIIEDDDDEVGEESFKSTVSLPKSITNTIETFYLEGEKGEAGTMEYEFTSIIIKSATKNEANIAYLELNEKLRKCLRDYVVTKNNETMSTSYLLHGNEVNLAIIYYTKINSYSVELVVRAFE